MQAGEEVLCLDNTITGRKSNVRQWWNYPAEFVRHDVTEPIKLEVDRIWHLACPASPIQYQTNPTKLRKPLCTYNMLGLARRVKARLLLASTSEVAATRSCTHNRRARRQPESIVSAPVATKASLNLCFDCQRMHGARSGRCTNTHGSRMLAEDGRGEDHRAGPAR